MPRELRQVSKGVFNWAKFENAMSLINRRVMGFEGLPNYRSLPSNYFFVSLKKEQGEEGSFQITDIIPSKKKEQFSF